MIYSDKCVNRNNLAAAKYQMIYSDKCVNRNKLAVKIGRKNFL